MKRLILPAFFWAVLLPGLFAQFSDAKSFFNNSIGLWHLAHVADVDGDGHQDLILQGANNSIYLRRGDGKGNFAVEELMKTNHVFFALADWGVDGDLDLIARDLATGNLLLYENDGLGGYDNWVRGFGNDVGQFYYGDMDGDGDKDFIFNIGTGFNSHVICCETGFTFPAPSCVQIANIAFDNTMCGGLFDEDALPDFCVSFKYGPGFQWYRNLGNGHFENIDISAGFPSGAYSSSKGVCNFDMDGDGDQDFFFWSADIKRIVWRENIGGGFFGPVQVVVDDPALTITALDIVPGDCDGDGDAELLALTDFGLLLFRNDGAAGFAKETILPGTDFEKVFFEDVNEDGFLDILIGRPSEVLLLLNNGACAFGPPQILLKYFVPSSESVTVADLDGNGKSDVLIGAAPSSLVGWFPNLGNTRFGSLRNVDANAGQALDVFAADLDGDLAPDILAVHGPNRTPGYYRNLGDSRFGAFLPIVPGTIDLKARKIHAADADGDGDADVFVSGTLGTAVAIVLLLNDGSGLFDQPSVLTATAPSGFCLREHPDFDQDGDSDLLYLDATSGGFFWRPDTGGGTYGNPVSIGNNGAFFSALPADFNGDGFPDIVASNQLGEIFWFESRQNGQNFIKNTLASTAPIRSIVTAGDFDGDGDNDVWASPQVNTLSADARIWVFENDGAGVFQAAFSLENKEKSLKALVAADMDADGDTDVAFCTDKSAGWYPNRRLQPGISGFCFLDDNENGQFDSGEKPLPDVSLYLSPGDLRTNAQADGSFHFSVPEGSYTLRFEVQNCLALTTGTSQYHPVFSGPPVTGHIFGFKKTGGAAKAEPHIAGGLLRCDQTIPLWIEIRNMDCQAGGSGRLMLLTDSLAKYSDSPVTPTTVSGDTVWWDLELPEPFQTTRIPIEMKIAGTDFHTTFTRMLATTYFKNADGALTPAGSYRFEDFLFCYDDFPRNNKMVDRTYVEENYTAETGEIRYTIRFQNIGKDTVLDLRLTDHLDTALMWPTFRPLGGSHPYSASIDLQKGIVEFFFQDINLPDSASNQVTSRGFVSFGIALKPGLPVFWNVQNIATLYFDGNRPLQTNWANTQIFPEVMVPAHEPPTELQYLRVFPNPSTGQFTVELPRPAVQGMTTRVVTLLGEVVLELTNTSGSNSQAVYAGLLPRGLYLLQAVTGNRVVAVGKVVIE